MQVVGRQFNDKDVKKKYKKHKIFPKVEKYKNTDEYVHHATSLSVSPSTYDWHPEYSRNAADSKYGRRRALVGRPPKRHVMPPELMIRGPPQQHMKMKIDKSLEREHQQNLRRGLFSAEEMIDIYAKEYPLLDMQCIIRFPKEIADLLKQRMMENEPLGLAITPTPLYDFRLFSISVNGIKKRLSGVLVELPNIIESYKTLDGDLMFKSGDVAQMIYVYDPNKEQIQLDALRDVYHWEYKSGLTPPTHRVRRRKFKNFNVFEKEEIRNAELEVLELLQGLTRDSYEFMDETEYDMLVHSKKAQEGEVVERVISAADDLEEILNGYNSDASDTMFGHPHTPWVKANDQGTFPLRTVSAGTPSRIGRPRRRGMGNPRGGRMGKLPPHIERPFYTSSIAAEHRGYTQTSPTPLGGIHGPMEGGQGVYIADPRNEYTNEEVEGVHTVHRRLEGKDKKKAAKQSWMEMKP